MLSISKRNGELEIERIHNLSLVHEVLLELMNILLESLGREEETDTLAHYQLLISKTRRILNIYEQQAAMYGPSDVPPHIVSNIEELESRLDGYQAQIDNKLRTRQWR